MSVRMLRWAACCPWRRRPCAAQIRRSSWPLWSRGRRPDVLLSECALCRFKLGRLSEATICAHDLMEHCRKELMPAYLPKLIVVLDAGPEPMLVRAPVAASSVTRPSEASTRFAGASQWQGELQGLEGDGRQGSLPGTGDCHGLARADEVHVPSCHPRECSDPPLLRLLDAGRPHGSLRLVCHEHGPKGQKRHDTASDDAKSAQVACVRSSMCTKPPWKDPTGMRSLPFCTALASWNVAPWAEALVRSLGNDQAREGRGSGSCCGSEEVQTAGPLWLHHAGRLSGLKAPGQRGAQARAAGLAGPLCLRGVPLHGHAASADLSRHHGRLGVSGQDLRGC